MQHICEKKAGGGGEKEKEKKGKRTTLPTRSGNLQKVFKDKIMY